MFRTLRTAKALLVATSVLVATTASAQTLFDEMAETGRFDHFLAGVRAAGLEHLLAGAPSVTVFAPTDAAYERATSGRLQAIFEDDVGLVRRVLETHIVSGKAFAADELPRTLEAANDETITIRWEEGRLSASVDSATDWSDPVRIETGDIRAANGIAHPIVGLLLPQDVTQAAASEHLSDIELTNAHAYSEEMQDTLAPDRRPMAPDETGSYLGQVMNDGKAAHSEPAPAATADQREDGRGEAAAREAARVAGSLASDADAEVVIEDMDVTVESAPRVEPRSVAASEMMGLPQQDRQTEADRSATPGGRADEGEPQAHAESGKEIPITVGETEADEMLAKRFDGWTVYAADGTEMGDVENIILEESGDVAGVLVETGGLLGIGGKLVRLDWTEFAVEAEDEALVTELAPGVLEERPAVDDYDLDP